MTTIYAIIGPQNISSLDFAVHYPDLLDRVLDDPNGKVIVSDDSGVSIYTIKYLQNHQYRNITVYHLGDKPRHKVGKYPTKGGFRTVSELQAALLTDSDRVLQISAESR